MLAALRFGPYVAIVALLVALLYVRGDKIKAQAETAGALREVKTLTKANESQSEALKLAIEVRRDNDRIQRELSDKLADISATANAAQEGLANAIARDPEAKSWADTDVPISVRNSLANGRSGQPNN